MRTIYIDSDYRCHVTDDGTMTPVETDVFDNRCDTYIEGYRFVPADYTWVRPDGVAFRGEMVAPWQPWATLDAAQREYEQEQLTAVSAQNAELLDALAAMVEDVYNQDVESIGEE